MRHYEIRQTPDDEAWGVDVPIEQFDTFSTIWEFTSGKRYESQSPVRVDIEGGKEVDFNVTGSGVAVLTLRARDAFEVACGDEVQFIPAIAQSGKDLCILNPLQLVDCIDHDRSKIQYHSSPLRAMRHKLGKPQMVMKLVLLHYKIQHRKIFRVQDWESVIVASEDVCKALVKHRISGIAFAEIG